MAYHTKISVGSRSPNAGRSGDTVKVGIGVGKKNAKLALSFALDKLIIPPNAVVCLLYVQTPFRRILNNGVEYGVQHVDSERVRTYKRQCFLEFQKLVNEYRAICNSRSVKAEAHYIESESVEKGLLDHACELGITLLILGRSGSTFRRALTSDIATSIAKQAPNFCTVMTIASNGKVSTHIDGKVSNGDVTESHDPISDMASPSGLREKLLQETVHAQNGKVMKAGQPVDTENTLYKKASRISFNPPMPDSSNEGIRTIREADRTTINPSMEDTYELEDDLISIRASPPRHEERKFGQVDVSWNRALKDAKYALQNASSASDRCEDLSYSLKEALRDQEFLKKQLDVEILRHKETQANLEKFKEMIHVVATEANSSKAKVQEERRRYEETIVKVDEANKKIDDLSEMLEVAKRLRKDAEEKAYHESTAKHEVLADLQRATRNYTTYCFEEIQAATCNFDKENKIGEGGCGVVYKGQLHGVTVAIKVLMIEEYSRKGSKELLQELDHLSNINHPHIVMLLGACIEKKCIVYEYIENGSLQDHLSCKNGMPSLPWYVRFKLCLEIATAVQFLHSQPKPIIHQRLNPSNIFLDQNFVSKIGDIGLAVMVPNTVTLYKDSKLAKNLAYIDPEIQRAGKIDEACDVYSLGIVMLQVLTGRRAIGVTDIVEDALINGNIEDVLDKSAGEWPLNEAMAFAQLSLLCAEPRRRNRPDLETEILPELESIERSAFTRIQKTIAPSFALCPISQEIMQDPYMAADGFTYEHRAIQAWLQEHSISPMTNLPISHKSLIPNHSLQSAIKEWFKHKEWFNQLLVSSCNQGMI